MKLSELKPGDVAEFLDGDGRFIVLDAPPETGDGWTLVDPNESCEVKKIGTGKYVPPHIVLDNEVDIKEQICEVMGLHPDTDLKDLIEAIAQTRSLTKELEALKGNKWVSNKFMKKAA